MYNRSLIKWIAKVFLIISTASVGVVLGMTIIFTVMGFPTFGITLGFLGMFVALGVWLAKCNKKIVIFVISFILSGIGIGITILDVTSLNGLFSMMTYCLIMKFIQ